MTEETVKDEIQHALARLVVTVYILCGVVAISVAGLSVGIIRSNSHIAEVANNTNAALCTLRSDLEQRIDDSRQFLEDHPNGIPGISAADIQQGITNQQRTIDALSTLEC